MIRNTFTQSGELVIILGDKKKITLRFVKSLQFAIVVLLSTFTVISCIVLEEVVVNSYAQRTLAVRTAQIQNQCTILSSQMVSSDEIRVSGSETIDAELAQLSNIYSGRVVVINTEFQIAKDTYNLQEGKTIVSEDVVRCYKGEQTSSYNEKERYYEIGTPIWDMSGKKVLGVMLFSGSTNDIRDNIDAMQSKMSMAAMTISIIGIILSVFISMFLVRPLKRMAKSINEMAEGYEDNYLHEKTFDETKEISEAFNKLWDRYKVIDASREEFVANVSHELKTPLTSMKVLADSLLAQPDVPVEFYQEFMGDMSQEIERENKIINDLLALVKLDKKGADIEVKSQNINELVERILKRLRPLAAKRNIELVFESFRTVTAEVDEVKFSLIVTNLVENAIKYNKDDGWVQVALNADHRFFYLKVADSGIGIPKEEHDHIFERFYRVDKSHSREIGGTGLGLSITRNAVIMHRGAIKVHSEPGEGTTFTVRIPLVYVNK